MLYLRAVQKKPQFDDQMQFNSIFKTSKLNKH